MADGKDWLQDPLMKNGGFRRLKSSNAEQGDKQSNWKLFHYATRLKLNGANFFCAKVIDIACTPEDELRWYLDGFFFELMAAAYPGEISRLFGLKTAGCSGKSATLLLAPD